ncbi:leucine-rich repeat domain-containing protein, partial [Adlercreutzia sp. ZJ304]|uniref:leucine-rich repeat domain-containing protein n=1 Tax=Adlercreutzia sp. ZJ304 TaxID=2709791 RepID=UPI0013EA1E1C
MGRTSIVSKTISVVLAFAFAFSMVPSAGIAFAAESNDATNAATSNTSDANTRTGENTGDKATVQKPEITTKEAQIGAPEGSLNDDGNQSGTNNVAANQGNGASQNTTNQGQSGITNAEISISQNGATDAQNSETDKIDVVSGTFSTFGMNGNDQATAEQTIFTYGGLTYEVNATAIAEGAETTGENTVTLVGWLSNAAPQGTLNIPATVTANNKQYTVIAITSKAADAVLAKMAADPDTVYSEAQAAQAQAEAAAAAAQAHLVTTINIPATVTSINPAAFAQFPNATAVNVNADNSTYSSYNGALYDAAKTNLHLVPEGMEGAAVLPDSVANVPACVFSRCDKLSAIIFSTGSTGNSHFATVNGVLYNNDKTQLIAAPAGLGVSAALASETRTITEGAFAGNDKLQTITVNGVVSEISADAFEESVVKNATVALPTPDVLAQNAEKGEGESTDQTTAAKAAWETAGFTHFVEAATPGETVVPAQDESGLAYTLLDNYTLSVGWQGSAAAPQHLDIPSMGEGALAAYPVREIADNAFANQTTLQTINLPDGLTTIGENAFANSGLTNVSIPAGVQEIGEGAFANTANLASAELHDGLRVIGSSAFEATAAKMLVLPASVQRIGESAFSGLSDTKIVALGVIQNINGAALGNSAGVQVYVPVGENAYARPNSETINDKDAVSIPALALAKLPDINWSAGAPAQNNHILSYGVQLADAPLQLHVGEEGNLLDGGYIDAPAGVDVHTGYSNANQISVIAGTTSVKAYETGNTSVRIALTMGDITLANATRAVIVSVAEKPVATEEPDKNNSEDGELVEPVENVTEQVELSNLQGAGAGETAESDAETNALKDEAKNAANNDGETIAIEDVSANLPNYTTEDNTPVTYMSFALMAESEVVQFNDGGIKYQVNPDEGSVSVIGLVDTTNTGAINIPARVSYSGSEYLVTTIANNAFENSGITGVNLPQGLKTIGDEAFYGCSGLTSITFPNTLVEIGSSAFQDTKFTSISLPSSLRTIKGYAFTSVPIAGELSIPEGVENIGSSVFGNNVDITKLTIPSTATNLAIDVAYGLSGATEILVASGNPNYTSVDGALFTKDMTTLMRYPASNPRTEYEIPYGVKTLAKGAFAGMKNLENIVIPNSVETLGNALFHYSSKLKTVRMSSSVKNVDSKIFSDTPALTEITWLSFPTGDVSKQAFWHYYSHELPQVTVKVAEGTEAQWESYFPPDPVRVEKGLPPRYKFVGESGIGATETGLETSDFTYTSLGDGTYSVAPKSGVSFEGRVADIAADVNNYHIAVTTIANNAFENSGITGVNLPQGLKTIGDEAFYGCSGLTSITFPNTLVEIGSSAFQDTKFTSISLPSSLRTIKGYAFTSVPIAGELSIPEGVENIGSSVFGNNVDITKLTIPSTATNLAIDVAYGLSGATEILVASGNPNYTSVDGALFTKDMTTLMRYPASNPRTEYEIPYGVKTLAKGAFAGMKNLENIVIPNSVETLGNALFHYSSKLKTVRMSSSVKNVDSKIFSDTPALTEITWLSFPTGDVSKQAFWHYYSHELPQVTVKVAEGTEAQWESYFPPDPVRVEKGLPPRYKFVG